MKVEMLVKKNLIIANIGIADGKRMKTDTLFVQYVEYRVYSKIKMSRHL